MVPRSYTSLHPIPTMTLRALKVIVVFTCPGEQTPSQGQGHTLEDSGGQVQMKCASSKSTPYTFFRVPTSQGKHGKRPEKFDVMKNTENILEILPKHRGKSGNLVCSSCKFPDSKGKRYFDICREHFHFFPRSWIGLPSQFCVCNSYKLCKLAHGKYAVGQGINRENTGQLENTI